MHVEKDPLVAASGIEALTYGPAKAQFSRSRNARPSLV